MNIEKNQIDDLNLQVTMAVAAEDYEAPMKKRLAERKRTADFKGFRKGMAPMSLIQRVYGEQALVEAVNDAVSEGLNRFIEENGLHLIGEPLTSEDQPELTWEPGQDFTFKFDMAVNPPVNIALGKEDKIPHYSINVTEAARKERKAAILRQLGSLQEGETAGEEDFVIADLDNGEKTVEGAYIAVRNVAGEAHAQFVGAKAGDRFDVDVNAAFTDETDRASMLKVKKEELEGLNPVFSVSIVNVKTFGPAEENQETYDKAFGPDRVHDAEEFDQAVGERLAAEYASDASARLSRDLREYLVKKADLTLPEGFLRRWLIHLNEGKYTAEDIDRDFEAFLADYRWQLVRSALMEQFSLEVTEEDMHEGAEAYAAYQYAMYGMGNVPREMIQDFAHRILADERQSRQVLEQVEDTKVLEAVKGAVTLQNKKISLDKFRELQ